MAADFQTWGKWAKSEGMHKEKATVPFYDLVLEGTFFHILFVKSESLHKAHHHDEGN